MKKLLLLTLAIFMSLWTIAQSTANYTFSTIATGSLTSDANSNVIDMTSGTTPLLAANLNDISSPVTNIGFTFYCMGNPFTQFSASSNGIMQLGSTAVSNVTYYPFYGTAAAPKISAFGGDLATSSTGSVSSKVVGTAPNRCLVVQFTDMAFYYNNYSADGTFQVRLYESGAMEFVYGRMIVGTTAYSSGYSIGFSTGTAANALASITTSTNTNNYTASSANTYTSNTAIANLNSSADGLRRVYTYTPQAIPAVPASLSFSAVSTTAMTVNWVDNSTTEVNFIVTRALDAGFTTGVTTTVVPSTTSSTTGTAYNTVVTGLVPGTTYYFSITASNEGGPSSGLTGNNSTNSLGSIYSVQSGPWSSNSTWSTLQVPSQFDNVRIKDGHTVTIDATGQTCYNLTVGQGASGVLRFGTTAATFTANGNVTVSQGAIFDAGATGGASLTHTLNIGGNTATSPYTGNLTNNGTFNMYIGSTNGKATLAFYGIPNTSISGYGSTPNFYQVTLNKGAVTATATVTPPILEIDIPYTVQGGTAIGLIGTHTAGTLKIASGFTMSNPVYSSVSYTIPALGGLWLSSPTFTVLAQSGNPTVNGLFRLSGSTYNVGTATGSALAMGSGAVVNIESGTFNTVGRLSVSSASNTINYTQSGGTVNVNTLSGGNTSASYYSFDAGTSTTTTFNMSGGSILITRGSGAGNLGGYDYRGPSASSPNVNITGGTLQLGTASTAASTVFKIQGCAPNVTLFATNNPGISLASGLIVYGDLTLNGTGTFTNNTLSLTMRGCSATNPGNITIPAGATFTMNTSNSQALAFTGSYGNQVFSNSGTITGSGTTGHLGSLTINNTYNNGAGTVTIPNGLFMMSGAYLTLTKGILTTSSLTLGTGGTTYGFYYIKGDGSISSIPTLNYGSGTVGYTYNGTTPQTTGGELPSAISGTLTINNPTGVTLNSPLSALGLTLTNGKLTTTSTNLITVTGATPSAVAGYSAASYVNGPIARTLPASYSSGGTFVFPVGKSAYKPLEMVSPITATGSSMVVLAEVFDANSGGSYGVNMSAINTDRYWSASFSSGGSNFTSTTVRLTEANLNNNSGIGKSSTPTGNYDLISTAPPSGSTIISTPVTTLGGYYVIGTKALPMSITSSTVTQSVTTSVVQNSTNQQIIGIQVVALGNISPMNVTSFTLNANGTTANSDISNAKLWYTGTSNSFATTTQVGATVASPTIATYTLTGTQTLQEGTNYFWLTYDIPLNATSTHVVDAECTGIVIGGTTYTPSPTAVTGTRAIVLNPPAVFTAVAASSSEIDLTWTLNSVGQNVMVATNSTSVFGTPSNGTAYIAGNTLPTGGTVIYNGPLSTFNHTGLNTATTYYYKAWSVDASSYYSTGITTNAKTTCAVYTTLPYTMNFDAMTTLGAGIMPDCWLAYATSGTSWYTGTAASVSYNDPCSSPNYAYASYSGGPDKYLITPGFQLTAGTSYDFKFKWVGDGFAGWTGNALVNTVQYGTGATALGASFILPSTTSTNVCTQASYSFTPSSTGAYYFMVKVNNTGTPWYLGFDDFSIAPTPVCPAPTALTASNISPTSESLGWTASATSYDIEYGPAGYTQGTGTVVTGVSNPYLLGSLTASTSYDYYVKAYCPNSLISTWAGPMTFKTLCNPTTVPFTENFDSYTVPSVGCGTVIDVNNDGKKWVTSAQTTYSGPNKLSIGYSGTGVNMDDWYFPQGIQLTGGQSYDLKFYYRAVYLGFHESLEVKIGTSPTVAAMTGPAIFNNPDFSFDAYAPVALSFTPPSDGVYYLGWHCYSAANQDGIYLDQITLNVTPVCFPPASVTANPLSPSSISVGWAGVAPTVDIDYGTVGHTAGTGTILSAVTANPTTISGLTPVTSYDVYIRQNCGDGFLSTWAGPVTVKTLCALTTDFSQNFDGVSTGSWPNCWVKVGYAGMASINSGSTASSPNYLYIFGSPGAVPVVAMPPVSNAGDGTHQLRFKLRGNWDIGDTLEVGYMTDRANDLSFVPVTKFTASTYTFTEYAAHMGTAPGSNTTIAFRAPGSLGYSMGIDDVYWETIPLCPIPTTLAAVPGNVFANLSWTAGGIESAWDIQWGPAGFTLGSGTIVTVSSSPYTLTGLTPATNYSFYVRADCGTGNNSAWAGPYPFRTLVACPTPLDLLVKNVQAHSATLGWTEPGTATTWNVQWGLAGFNLGTGTIISGITSLPYTLTGLASGTTYGFYVQSDCGGGTTSTWGGPYTFTTLCEAVTALPWTEGFEGMTSVGLQMLPPCWTYENVAGTTGPTSSASSGYFYGPHTGAHFIYTSYNNTTWIFTPQMLLSNVSYDFTFYMQNKVPTNPIDYTMDVAYGSTNSSAGMTNVLASNVVCSNSSYVKFTYTFTPPTAGLYYFGVKTTSQTNGPNYISFDDFKIQVTPPCVEPTNLVASNITANAASIGWTGGENVQIDYGPAGHVVGNGTNTGTVNSNPYSIGGLDPSVAYDAYVRMDCGVNGFSTWGGPVSFTTLCNSVSDFTENFDAVTSPALPMCWSKYTSASYPIQKVETYSYSPYSPPNYVHIYNGPATSANDQPMLISPPIANLSSGNHWLRFYAKESEVLNPVPIIVGTLSDPTNSATFTPFATVSGLNASTWVLKTVDFSSYSGTDQYIAIRQPGNYPNTFIYIDDVVWEAVTPTLTVSPTSLAFGYTPNGSISAENAYYIEGMDLSGSGNVIVTAPAGFEVSLTYGTGYGSSVSIPVSGYLLLSTRVYVRFVPTATGIYYSGTITNIGGGASTGVDVTGNSDIFSSYCISEATLPYDEDIFNVTVGNLNNSSNCSTTGGPGSILNEYSNYMSLTPAELNIGSVTHFSLTSGTCGGSHPNAFKIFIDYNQNGTFDANEEVYVSPSSTSGPHTETGTFTVPVSAIAGTTLMRVICMETSTPSTITACNTYLRGETEDYKVTLGTFNKTLNLTSVFLEGFYTGNSTMMQATQKFPDGSYGPKWADGSADHISVELHTPGDYTTVVYASTNVPLSTSGAATVSIPAEDNGTYYLTIKQRNHLETVSALPLSFAGATITFAFDALTQAYEGNMTQVLEADNETMSPPLIFGGDVNQDAQIESDDINAVGNDAAAYVLGFGPTDIVPDAQVESADINIVGNNAAMYVFAHIPM